MYFDNFPTFLYPFKVNNKTEFKLVTDISQNVRVRKEILANITLYDEYDIREGETPEIIAPLIPQPSLPSEAEWFGINKNLYRYSSKNDLYIKT